MWCEDDQSGEGDCDVLWTKYTRTDVADEMLAMLEDAMKFHASESEKCKGTKFKARKNRHYGASVALWSVIQKAKAIKAKSEVSE